MELSLQRLIAMPAIILLVVLFILQLTNDTVDAWKTIHYASLGGFVLIGLLWGIKTASDAVLDEYNEKTWDWQKMSIIGPWKLAFGKLFGSTIYNWYGALLCWLLFMYSASYMKSPIDEYKTGLLLILAMISTHGFMILISLQLMRNSDERSNIKSNRIFIVGLLILAFLSNIFSRGFLMNRNLIKGSWYSLVSDPWNISLVIAAFYCFWVIAALYRNMRRELQFKDSPTWWLAFIVSNIVFQYGFFSHSESFSATTGLTICFYLLFIQMTFAVYFLALTEAKDIVNFRLLLNSLKKRAYRTFFDNVPLWILTIPIAFFLGFVAIVFFSINPVIPIPGWELSLGENAMLSPFHILLVQVALMGFLMRDMGILLLLNFSTRAKRADAAFIIYLVLIYALLPAITKDIGNFSIFFPDISAGKLLMVLFPLIEAGIVVYFLVSRWREINSLAKTS
jgi:hypothetical protein